MEQVSHPSDSSASEGALSVSESPALSGSGSAVSGAADSSAAASAVASVVAWFASDFSAAPFSTKRKGNSTQLSILVLM